MPDIRICTPKNGWSEVFVGDDKIGGFGETTREQADMRWYWSAAGTYGYRATRDEAIADIEAVVPRHLEHKAVEDAARAAFDALPDHLRALKAALNRAEFEKTRAWGHSPFNSADYQSAEAEWFAARRAFDAAHSEWLATREAA